MIANVALAKARRSIAFGRHIPVRRLARRLELVLRRRLRDCFATGRTSGAQAPTLASDPPPPVFPPRQGPDVAADGALVFHLLGRDLVMSNGLVDWAAAGLDPKHQLIRMNLHYMEYLESVDDRLFAELAEQWIDSNPGCTAGAWRHAWNSYALSLRVVVWMQQLAVRSARLNATLRSQMHASLVEQLRFLVSNLETDIGGNHLIKNVKALIWASAYFDGAETEQWRHLALEMLSSEIASQVLADGMHYERSPSYHCQVFADILECRHALGSDPFGRRLDATLSRMAQVVVDLAHPDGHVAQFNDSGLSMSYDPALCIAAYEAAGGHRPAPGRIFAYDQAGYFGLRDGDTYFIADCGRISPDDLPAHGHGDILSFEWSVGGQRIVVDQGVFEYVAGKKRHASRSAASHNTLCLDGADQADFFSAFRCGRRPDVGLRRYEILDDGFVMEGSHDGFSYLHGRPRHVRSFAISADRVMISDKLEGATDRVARIGFLLHPEVAAEIDGATARLSRGAAQIAVDATLPIQSEPAVWWPDMGHEVATRRLVLVLPVSASEVTTTFRIRSREAAA